MTRKYESLTTLELDNLLKMNLNIKTSTRDGLSNRDVFCDSVLNKIRNLNLDEEFIANLFSFIDKKKTKNINFEILVCDINVLKMAVLKTIDENKEIIK